MSEVRRYEFDENGVCYHKEDGPFVSFEDYARLKAESQSYKKAVTICVDSVIDERNSLKAEVQRLRSSSFVTAVPCEEYDKLKAENERLNERLNRHIEINDELDARCSRLRKAGDWMFNAIILNSDKDIEQGMKAWNAAKDGKPSE